MVYKKQFALSIRANGKILREREDSVFIPFGTQYEVVMKNLNSVSAIVRVWIDGDLVSGISPLVIKANETFVLKRSFVTGNDSHGNAFKFIERTERVEDYRGVKIDDGLVRVEYQFEKIEERVREIVRTYERHFYPPIYSPPVYSPPPLYPYRPIFCADPNIGVSYSSDASSAVGITVPGGVVEQSIPDSRFVVPRGEKSVLVLQLVGQVEDRKVEKVVDVKTKIRCDVCGKSNRGTARFCSECGAGLVIV